MEQLIANITGQIRREQLGGRQYVVAPAVLIKPGVLNGSRGPLYYPPEEVTRNPSAWNGIPIVRNHPIDQNGHPVSARTPNVLNSSAIGMLLNASANGKLTAEAWFDEEAVQRVDNRIHQALVKNTPFELSTGLDLDEDPQSGVFNSVQYHAIARNYRPDHLAVFIDKTGACSLEDGCGVLVNENKQTIWTKLGQLLGIVDGDNASGTTLIDTGIHNQSTEQHISEDTEMDKKELIDSLITNCECWTGEDRNTLDTLDEKKLKILNDGATKGRETEEKLKEQQPVVNAAQEGFSVGNDRYTLNGKGELVRIENQDKPKSGDDKGDEKPAVINMENLPPEIQEDIRFARQAKQEERDRLIARLTANLEGDTQKQQAERLGSRSLDDLRADVELLPVVTENEEQRVNDYSGAAVGGPTAHNVKGQPVPLGQPVWNFDAEKQTA